MAGWLKTLDGADVYTEDGEWYWSHESQGWFHAPGLLTAVPAPPLDVRLRDEARRLRHGWPSFWKVFDVRNAAMTLRYNLMSVVYLAALVWMWVWKIGIDYGIHNVARSWQMEIVNQFRENYPGAWWVVPTEGDTDQHARHLVFTILFALISLIILYSMHVGVATAADPHKGMLLLGAVVAVTTLHEHQRRQRRHDQQFARDIAGELHRRHDGGPGAGYR